ncbi:MAG: hypothetical protein SGILL_009438 [Bacillariaceae sp.]
MSDYNPESTVAPTSETMAEASVSSDHGQAPPTPTAPRRLTCFFQTETENEHGNLVPGVSASNEKTKKTFLVQEEGKKSSFLLLEPKDDTAFYCVEKPPCVVIEYTESESDVNTFFLGGFQLISSAKSTEVYLTDLQGKETYLTTSKGIPFNKEDTTASWYKAITVVPGGPRPISRLRIKLLSLRPTDASVAKLQFIKLTARIAEPPSPTSISQHSSSLKTSPNGNSGNENNGKKNVAFEETRSAATGLHRPTTKSPLSSPAGITQSDIGAAMAGVSFMARSTEKSIEETLNDQTKRMEKYFGSCFLRLDQQMQFLQRHLIVQQQLIQENNDVMLQQQQLITDQSTQLRTLLQQQEDMKIRLQSLQADMSIVRYQRLDPSKKTNSSETSELVDQKSSHDATSPLAMEIGTKVRDIDDAEDGEETPDDDIVSDGIVDHQYMGDDGNATEYHVQNIQLKNLIQKTAREIDERPVSCQPVNCGPLMDKKPLACGTLPSFPDDGALFKGMMLTDEEMRYQQMSLLRASRGEGEVSLPKEGDEEIDTDVTDDALAESVDRAEDAPKDEKTEDQTDACVNIEVTLMDDEAEDQDEGGNDKDVAEEQMSPPPTTIDGVGDRGLPDRFDSTATATCKDTDMVQPVEEKKEMEN